MKTQNLKKENTIPHIKFKPNSSNISTKNGENPLKINTETNVLTRQIS
jgi:hypothetical protein